MTESAIRRALAAKGLRLKKAPSRHWTRAEYDPGYQVVDDRNVVVLGCGRHEYDASLDDVQTLLSRGTTGPRLYIRGRGPILKRRLSGA